MEVITQPNTFQVSKLDLSNQKSRLYLFFVSLLGFGFWCEGNDARHHQASETAQKGTPVVKVQQPIEVPTIPFSELKEATDDFGSNSLIGEGSYGRVYYGVLNNDLLSAIKKLDSNKQPDTEFLAQVFCFLS